MTGRWAASGDCAVVGVGATEFSKASGRSELTLALESATAAAADAGIGIGAIDGIVSCDLDHVRWNDVTAGLGLGNVTYWSSVGPGGVAPCGMVGQAVAAIHAGLAETVLVYRALNGRSGLRYGTSPPEARAAIVGGDLSYDEFFAPYGLVTPGQMFALMARRHMDLYGTTSEDLGAIALSNRAYANNNPAAQMYDRPLTLLTYLDSPMIAAPLRLYDFCMETDGGCAVIVTTTERARDLAQPPAVITSVAQASGSELQPGLMFPFLTQPSLIELSSTRAGELLFARAGLTPSDVDVAQFYDCFTISILLQLEDYGFCPRGEGGRYVSDGNLSISGALPCNTAGGNLSEGYLHGLNHVLEGVRQIRGTSTNQVPGASVSLVTSSPPHGTSALLLTSEPI